MSATNRFKRLLRGDFRALDLRSYAEWRIKRAKSSWAASRVVDGRGSPFLVRELLPGKWENSYSLHGRTIRLVHHTEDVAAFKELFVAGVYDLPPDWAAPTPSKIADLGGNIGMFGLYTSIRWPSAQLVAFEPEPRSATRYRELIAANEIRCDLIQACAGVKDGRVNFTVGEHVSAHITQAGTGAEVSILDVFPYLDQVSLLKMDIEGGEWPIVLDERFKSISANTLMMEYHRHMCPEADPKALISRILAEAGFDEVIHKTWDDRAGAGELYARRT